MTGTAPGQRAWQGRIAALCAYLLLLQAVLVGVVAPRAALHHASLPSQTALFAGALCLADPGGPAPGPAGAPAHDALCLLACATRGVTADAAAVPEPPPLPRPALAAGPASWPSTAAVMAARSPLPIGARGPPA